jgi:Protein of unknown function (DUF4058)
MPVHDWTRVFAGIFHDFHREWISTIKHALNNGLLPKGYYALGEQIAGGPIPDVLTLQRPVEPRPSVSDHTANGNGRSGLVQGGSVIALAERRPKTRYQFKNESHRYAAKANAITIRHVSEHDVVAVIEIVSPGNKSGSDALQKFISKAHELLSAGVHLVVIDLFPPGKRDPSGIHPLIWDDDNQFEFDPAKPLTIASYVAALSMEAFVENFAVGDSIPETPIFLDPDLWVELPLNQTYATAFAAVPEYWRDVIEGRIKV